MGSYKNPGPISSQARGINTGGCYGGTEEVLGVYGVIGGFRGYWGCVLGCVGLLRVCAGVFWGCVEVFCIYILGFI